MLRRGGQLVSILLASAVLSQALWAGMLECRCACCRPAAEDSTRVGEDDSAAAADLPACCRAKAAKTPPGATRAKASRGRPGGCPPEGCSGCFCSAEEDRFVERIPVYVDSAPKAALLDLTLAHDAQDSPATIALGRWRCEALGSAAPTPLRALYCVWRN